MRVSLFLSWGRWRIYVPNGIFVPPGQVDLQCRWGRITRCGNILGVEPKCHIIVVAREAHILPDSLIAVCFRWLVTRERALRALVSHRKFAYGETLVATLPSASNGEVPPIHLDGVSRFYANSSTACGNITKKV